MPRVRSALPALLGLTVALLLVAAAQADPRTARRAAGPTTKATGTTTCGAGLLGVAADFNVFVQGDYAANATSVGGSLGAGGSININSFGVGAQLPPNPSRADVVAGRDLTVGGGGAQAQNGSVTYGRTLSGSISTPHGTLTKAPPAFDVDAEFTTLRARADANAGLTANGSVSGPQYGALSLTGTDPSLNVFRLTKAITDATQVIRLRVPVGSSTIVDLPATTFSTAVFPIVAIEIWNGTAYAQYGDTAPPQVEAIRQRLLWNLAAATSVQIGPNLAWHGTVLAPRADLYFPGSTQLNGTIIAKSMSRTNGGAAFWHPFLGCAPTPRPTIVPVVECVEDRGSYLVGHFGYDSPAALPVDVGVGADNRFDPEPGDRGQPTTFLPGRQSDVLALPFTGELTWSLTGQTATAAAGSPRCAASLRIDKALLPSGDSGRFDLLLDGEVLAAAVGQGGSTGTVAVTAAPHTVGEAGALGTDLADYATTIICREDGGAGVAVAQARTGPSLTVTPTAGQALVCTIANVRKDIDPPPGPTLVDLFTVKSVSSPSATVGDTVTWTVQVGNRGPDVATDVVVEDQLPDGVSFVRGSLDLPAGASCAGPRCTIDALGAGQTVTATFETIAVDVGPQTNTVVASSRFEDTNPADNASSATVTVGSGVDGSVQPILECVEALGNGRTRAHLGYLSSARSAVTIPIGRRNAFAPAPEHRGQPVDFEPGRAIDVVQVTFTGSLAWTLDDSTLRIADDGERCAATLRVDKVLRPIGDPGRFDLEIDGVPAGAGEDVGDGGTTGDVAVVAEPGGTLHQVGEQGAGGTALSAYESSVVCRDGGGAGEVVTTAAGPAAVVRVEPGDAIVCTILNRATATPVPPIDPPVDPGGDPDPVPASADLAVTKVVSRGTAQVGGLVTWRVRVSNRGPETATGVRIVDRPPAGLTLVSLHVGGARCTSGDTYTCQLGSLAPGQSVTLTATTRLDAVGARVNNVRVFSDVTDANPENDVASALVRVVGRSLAATCGSLRVDRETMAVGRPVRVHVHATNALGRPLAATIVRAVGAGVRATARTDAGGTAILVVHPLHAGLVGIAPAATAVDPEQPTRCLAGIHVLPGVTG